MGTVQAGGLDELTAFLYEEECRWFLGKLHNNDTKILIILKEQKRESDSCVIV